jgi:hypothetical protein
VIKFVEFVSPRDKNLAQEFCHLADPITQIDKHVLSLLAAARLSAQRKLKNLK